MYAVCVACSASSAEMAVTFASSYSHPHLLPPPEAVVPVADVADAAVAASAARDIDDDRDPDMELSTGAGGIVRLLSLQSAV